MVYPSLLADITLFIHAGFVFFVLFGQVLILAGWTMNWIWTRNIWFRVLHLLAIGFVMLETWLGLVCPLTTLENFFRRRAGMEAYETSFISDWLSRLLFYSAPGWVFTLAYTGFFFLVLITLWGYPPVRRRL